MIGRYFGLCILSATLMGGPGHAIGNEDIPSALEAGWKGEKVCELLHEDAQIRTLKCTFAPGVGHEKHYHPSHVGYVLKGGPMLTTDAAGSRVQGSINSTGVTWVSDGIEWHEALNVGDDTTQYIIIEKKY